MLKVRPLPFATDGSRNDASTVAALPAAEMSNRCVGAAPTPNPVVFQNVLSACETTNRQSKAAALRIPLPASFALVMPGALIVPSMKAIAARAAPLPDLDQESVSSV